MATGSSLSKDKDGCPISSDSVWKVGQTSTCNRLGGRLIIPQLEVCLIIFAQNNQVKFSFSHLILSIQKEVFFIFSLSFMQMILPPLNLDVTIVPLKP